MRLLVATDQWFPDFKGGSARVATATTVALAARGHEAIVLTPPGAGDAETEPAAGVTIRRSLRRHGLPQTLADAVTAARAAARLRGRIDLVVAHQTTVAAGIARAGLDVPIALVYHASAPRELRYLRERTPSLARRTALRMVSPTAATLDRRAVAASSGILVLSAFTRSLLAEDHPEALDRVRIVRGGVDTEHFSPGDGQAAARRRLGLEDGPLLVAVRRLEPRMGLEQLLEAVALMESPGPRLAIVGDGVLRDVLPRRARELGVADRVRMVGPASEQSLPDWYRAADVVVVPTQVYEGFGLTTIEALACGSVVVGTPAGATPELLAPLDPRLVAAGIDARSLADALAAATSLRTPAFRASCRRHAIAQYAWDTVADAWERNLVEVASMPVRRSRRAS